MSEDFSKHFLKLGIAQIAKELGFNSVRNSALLTVSDVVEECKIHAFFIFNENNT